MYTRRTNMLVGEDDDDDDEEEEAVLCESQSCLVSLPVFAK